jgi:hypothetical protein
VALRHELDAKVLRQQQRRHARAIDEQVAGHGAPGPRLQRCDVAVVVAMDGHDDVQQVLHAQPLGAVPLQQHAELAGVEVVAVVGHGGIFGRGRLLGCQALRAQVRLEAHQVGKRHVGVSRQPGRRQGGLGVALGQHERVEVVVRRAAVDPAVESRALLERRIAVAEQVGLGHAHAAQGVAHGRPGAFAHPDGADVRRLQQRDLQSAARAGAVRLGQHGRGQPAGRAAADDHHVLHRFAQHRTHRLCLPIAAGRMDIAGAPERRSRWRPAAAVAASPRGEATRGDAQNL